MEDDSPAEGSKKGMQENTASLGDGSTQRKPTKSNSKKEEPGPSTAAECSSGSEHSPTVNKHSSNVEDSGCGLDESGASNAVVLEKSDAISSDDTDDEDTRRLNELITNLKSGVRTRNYRGRNSSSSSSDVSLEGVVQREGAPAEQPDGEEDGEDSSSVESSHNSTTSDEDEEGFMLSDMDGDMDPIEDEDDSTDSDDDYGRPVRKIDKEVVDEILDKPKPPYGPSIPLLLMRRENGYLSSRFTRNRGCKQDEDYKGGFGPQTYATRYFVERMTRSHTLDGHRGCVNSLNFNTNGSLLASGSDDQKIIIWDWALGQKKHVFQTLHVSNIFQTKFVPLSGTLDIVSSGRDGQVRYTIFPPSGAKTKTFSKQLFKHPRAVHKVVLTPNEPHELFSAGEDGQVMRYDLREDSTEKVCTVQSKRGNAIRLFSISHHPYDQEFCVAGSDPYVRVYDKRNYKKPVWTMCPLEIDDKKEYQPSVTCAVYNYNGNDILASYSDEYIYLFNNRVYITGHFTHQYKGHVNHKTIKSVNFFGPRSEYIISGSDCGHIFYWEKETEAIVNYMKGDRSGIVNCLEPHPSIPVVATSGLDNNIKMWTPSSKEYPPNMENLGKCVERNLLCMTDNHSVESAFMNFAETSDDEEYIGPNVICHPQ